ncbi:MAG: hypothetical protein OXC98_09145 [bacterium]|nr:hypothetical protein [Acidimicrobiia bacterium]MCY4650514.1 hypothetical protein [bacterium]
MGIVTGKPHPDVESAASALMPFSSGLAADGYALEVSAAATGSLQVEIVAGPDACEDCLIPKEMFKGMLSSRLGSEGVAFSELILVYPAG